MKRVLPCLQLTAFTLAVGFFTRDIAAQSAPAATDAATSPESILVLSPFEVSSERDVGFVAASSLAGGRLTGELKDTAAAYSVLTREFIDALNLTDLTEATEWTVNSTSIQGAGDDEIFGNGFDVSSRGVSASGKQRNFFPLNVSYDSYNLDRYDYSRGPNAVLFGNGTFGGTANVVTKRAQLDRRFGSIRASYGSWDDRRITYDDNRPLTANLAVRVNALLSERQGWRDYDMEKKKAITLAATWKLSANTEFFVEGEVGQFRRNNPPTFLRDRFAGWNGTTVFPNLVSNSTAPSSGAMQAAGIGRYGNDTTPIFVFSPDLGMTSVGNFANTMRTIGAGQNGPTPVGGVPRPPGSPNLGFSGQSILDAPNAPPWRFDAAIAGSNFEVPERDFAISTLSPTFTQNYQTYSAFLRNRVGRNLYLETAANISRESRRTNYLNARNLNDVIIDINQRMPDGSDNPYFLEPYGQGQRSRGGFSNDYASARIAAAYTLPDTPLGDYTFNLMGGVTEQQYEQRIESLRVLRSSDPRNWPFNEPVFYRYYWNGTNREMPEVNEAVFDGVTYPVKWIGDAQRPTDISYTDTKFTYIQAAIKAKFFNSRLHALGAVRHDDLSVDRTINDNYGDYPSDWDGVTYQYRQSAPADYLSLEEVRPRSNRIPTVTDGRYQDDFNPPEVTLKATTFTTGVVYHAAPWFSVFANYGTSFNPSSSQVRLDNSIMPSPESSGWDVGLKLFLLENRVSINLLRYEGEESAQPFEISFTNNLQSIGRANVVGDLSPEGENIRGFPIVPRQAFDRRDRKNEGYEFEVVANLTRSWRLSANAAWADARQTNAWADTRAFLEEWEPTMRQVALDSGVVFNPETGRAEVDTSIPADQRIDSSSVSGAWNNIFFTQLPNIVDGEQKVPNLTEFTANIFTDYEFNAGRLKGFRIGGGLNYRGQKVLGFRGADTIQDPAQPGNPSASAALDDPNVDAYTPVYSDPYYTATMTLGYTMRLRENRRLTFQLRVANLLNETDVIYTTRITLRPPDGDYLNTAARVSTPVDFRYQTPRSYTFTTTLSF